MSRYNLNILFALDAILSNPTLTQAARAINLSQPAMSLSLKRLRETFCDELVRYNHGETEYSPLAEKLRPLVAEILVRSNDLIGLARSFEPGQLERTFRLLAPASTLFVLLPPLIAKLAVEAPRVSLEARIFRGEALSQETRYDASLLPLWAVPEGVDGEVLLHENLSCLVNVDAGIGAVDDRQFLEMDHAAMPEAEDLLFWPLGSPAEMLMRRRRVVTRTHSLDALPHLATNRRLIVTATTRFTQHHAALNPRLMSIPAPACLSPVRFALCQHTGKADEPAVRWFADQIRHICALLSPRGQFPSN